MKKGAVYRQRLGATANAAASTRAMPKDMASKRIHGSDAWCAVHQLPFASLSVGFQANARTANTGRRPL